MSSALSTRDLQLLKMPTIETQMPVRFNNGAEWTELKGECKGSGCTLPEANMRGSVLMPFPNVAVVEAVGVCHDCKLVTRFLYRLHDDMRITGPRNGKWLEWDTKTSFVDKLRTYVGL